MFYKYSCNYLNIVIYTRIMSQRAVRSRRRKSEDDIVREILKLQNILMKEHKTASLVAISSKFGLLQFGSENVTKKFNGSSLDWMDVFELDDDELINGVQTIELETEDDDLNSVRASLVPKKLPATVNLMKYEELWKWITQEILKEYWRKVEWQSWLSLDILSLNQIFG